MEGAPLVEGNRTDLTTLSLGTSPGVRAPTPLPSEGSSLQSLDVARVGEQEGICSWIGNQLSSVVGAIYTFFQKIFCFCCPSVEQVTSEDLFNIRKRRVEEIHLKLEALCQAINLSFQGQDVPPAFDLAPITQAIHQLPLSPIAIERTARALATHFPNWPKFTRNVFLTQAFTFHSFVKVIDLCALLKNPLSSADEIRTLFSQFPYIELKKRFLFLFATYNYDIFNKCAQSATETQVNEALTLLINQRGQASVENGIQDFMTIIDEAIEILEITGVQIAPALIEQEVPFSVVID